MRSTQPFLAAAPASPVCSQVAAMVSVNDVADRPARALADGEVLRTGRHAFKWIDAYYAHSPHTAASLEKLARDNPTTLAVMHGSAWRGDGAALLRTLSRSLTTPQLAAVRLSTVRRTRWEAAQAQDASRAS